jgi:hypothetical protein
MVFGAFHEILSICYNILNHMAEAAAGTGVGGSGNLFNVARPAARASAFHPSDVTEKYKGLVLRCRAWLNEAKGLQVSMPVSRSSTGNTSVAAAPYTQAVSAGQPGVGPKSPLMKRYYAVADDTLHPEVREVMRLAMMELPGWELDPIDQVSGGSWKSEGMS